MSTEAQALRRLTATEFTLFLREKVGPIFGVLFPVALLSVFANIKFFTDPASGIDGVPLLYTYVPILVGFVLAMLAINTLPPVLAGYREQGVLRRLRTTPVGPARVLGAQLAICFATAVVAVLLLLAVARFAWDVPLPKAPGAFALTAVLAALSLIGIALLIAAVAPTGKAANATGAVLFYVMMFFAGLWLPIQAMPKALRQVSEATPLGAAVQSLTDASAGHWPPAWRLAVLAGYAVVGGLLGVRLFRWE
jgi:ABC-2 type transport system permease protein